MSRRFLLSLTVAVAVTGCGDSPSAKQPPVAVAGVDATVKVGATVVVDGSRSRDPQGLPLHYHWKLTPPAGGHATLDHASAVQPTFVPDLAGLYTITLAVDDGALTSVTTSVTVTATRDNLAPVADAGQGGAVKVGAVVQLDGSASSDADGDTLTYQWTLQPPAGSQATIDSPGSQRPHFTADVAGMFVATLVVHDGRVYSAPATVTFTATKDNLPPVAHAGADATVATSTRVQLDGSPSSDADGDPLTYRWQLTAPAHSAATLDAPSAAKPAFTADVAGQYTVTLVVNDGKVDSAPTSITITAEDKPVAQIAGAATAWVNDKLALDGSGSTSPGHGTLTYRWSLAAPAGSQAALDDKGAPKPSFTADVAGSYTVSLVVSDGALDSDAAHLTVVARAHTAPVAVVAASSMFCYSFNGLHCNTLTGDHWRVDDDVTLDGSRSRNSDSGTLSYAWTVIDPTGAAVSTKNIGANSEFVHFAPALVGSYQVTLVVNDGFTASAATTMTLTVDVANRAPIADAGPDQTVTAGDTVTLPGNRSSDADGDALTYDWQIKAPAASSATLASGAATPTFVADVAGTYVVTLSVYDGRVASKVDVTIVARPHPVVFASGPRTIATGATITVGTAAAEAGGGGLRFAWTIKSGPSTDPSLLSATDRLNPKFTPPFDGDYVLELVATDDNGISASGDTTITAISPIARPAGQLGNHYQPNRTISFFNNSAQGIERDTLIYSWSYDPAWNGGIKVISSSSDQTTYFVQPIDRGDLLITLTVTNNNGTHASSGSVKVFIDPANP